MADRFQHLDVKPFARIAANEHKRIALTVESPFSVQSPHGHERPESVWITDKSKNNAIFPSSATARLDDPLFSAWNSSRHVCRPVCLGSVISKCPKEVGEFTMNDFGMFLSADGIKNGECNEYERHGLPVLTITER